MKITVSENAGFCPGVRRADEAVRALIASSNKDKLVFTIGHLIHNEIYNDNLAARGVKAISHEDIPDVLKSNPEKQITFVIRTHGVTKDIFEYLSDLERGNERISVVDMTCPYVKKIQKIAEESTSDQTHFVLFGAKNHPEVQGIISYAKGDKTIISSLEEAEDIKIGEKIPILCSQTTQNLLLFVKIKNFFKKRFTNAQIFDTICSVTENRQNEAIGLARTCDMMLIIGSKESANTKKLFEISCNVCKNTQWIQSLNCPPIALSGNIKKVGITAGASTPDGIILEVYKAMENFSELLEGSLKTLHTGETVTGIVETIGKNEINLDLGAKFTGVLTKEQITDDANAVLSDMFKVGDEVEVFVIRVEDSKGIATVSKKRVDKDNSWVALKDAFDANAVLEGKVTNVIKGGVIVSTAGNTVFVPASQTGVAKGESLDALLGTEQKIKLLEFDPAKKKALGSIKKVINEEKRAAEDAIFATLEVGKHYVGIVKNLTNYGAFVDIGGVDGMVHNTELTWKKIKHPSQVVSVGQELDVYIKELDIEKRRISLGYKTQDMDAWFKFTQKYSVGDVVSAKIVSLMPFGAFAEVMEDVDGLIHISRISTQRISSPAEVLKVGDVVDVKITEIDNENRKLALSIRALLEIAEREAAEAKRAEEEAIRKAEAEAEAKRLEEERADMAPYIVGSI